MLPRGLLRVYFHLRLFGTKLELSKGNMPSPILSAATQTGFARCWKAPLHAQCLADLGGVCAARGDQVSDVRRLGVFQRRERDPQGRGALCAIAVAGGEHTGGGIECRAGRLFRHSRAPTCSRLRCWCGRSRAEPMLTFPTALRFSWRSSRWT